MHRSTIVAAVAFLLLLALPLCSAALDKDAFWTNRDLSLNNIPYCQAPSPPAPLISVNLEWQSSEWNGVVSHLVNDVDSDGTYEIFAYYDETVSKKGTLRIISGDSHAEEWSKVFSEEHFLYPLVTDIDSDGTREIIAATYTAVTSPQYLYHSYIYQFDGKTHTQEWKSSDFTPAYVTCIAADDIDNDGTVELIIETYEYINPTWQNQVIVLNGKTHAQEWASPLYTTSGGVSCYINDTDSDQVKELIIYYTDPSYSAHLYIFSGDTHTQEWSKDFSETYLGVQVNDTEKDGTWDIIICAYTLFTSPPVHSYIYEFDGKTHSQKWKSSDFSPKMLWYVYVVDIDGDGTNEYVGSLAEYDSGTYTYSGQILILNAVSHSQEWLSQTYDGYLGIQVSDVEPDSVKEIVVVYSGNTDKLAHILIFGGNTHASEWTKDLPENSASVYIADLDLDGTNELIVPAWTTGTTYHGYLYIFDAVSHSQEWKSNDLTPFYIWFLTIIDVDGDGGMEIVASAYYYDSVNYYYHGKIFVYGIAPNTQQFSVPLQAGWNLISVPYKPLVTDIAQVLSSINGKYSKVQYYDASDANDHWKVYDVSKPSYMNDLKKLDNLMGVWLYMTQGGTLSGQGIKTTTTIHLKTGWNLVGYPTDGQRTVSSAFGSLWKNGVERVMGIDSGNQYRLKELFDSDNIGSGSGFWVYCSKNCDWVVDW